MNYLKFNFTFLFASLLILTSCEKDNDNPDQKTVTGKRMISNERYLLYDGAIPQAYKTEYKYLDNKLVEKKNYFKENLVEYNPAITIEETLKNKEWMYSYTETFSYYPDSLVYNKTKNIAGPELSNADKNARREVYYLKNGLATKANSYELSNNAFILNSKVEFAYENGLLITIKVENKDNDYSKYEKIAYAYQDTRLSSVEYYSSDDNTSFSLENKEVYKYSDNKISEIEQSDEDWAPTKEVMVYSGDQLIRIDRSYYLSGSQDWIKNRYSEFKTEGNTLKKSTYWLEGENFKLYESAIYNYDDGGDNWDELFKIFAFPQANLYQIIYGGF